MNYTVVVAKPTVVEARRKTGLANYLYPDQPRSYKKSLQELASEKGVELKLIFPEKGQYIMAEMGLPFITSVFLIVIVFVLFWQTILSLRKEKKKKENKIIIRRILYFPVLFVVLSLSLLL